MIDEDLTKALERNDDLVERLRGGDVSALSPLIEAMTGSRVVQMRIIEDKRAAG